MMMGRATKQWGWVCMICHGFGKSRSQVKHDLSCGAALQKDWPVSRGYLITMRGTAKMEAFSAIKVNR